MTNASATSNPHRRSGTSSTRRHALSVPSHDSKPTAVSGQLRTSRLARCGWPGGGHAESAGMGLVRPCDAAVSARQRPARGSGHPRASGPRAACPRATARTDRYPEGGIGAGQRANMPRMYLPHLTCGHCDAEGALQLPGRPRPRTGAHPRPRAGRVRGRPETGIHLGRGVLNPC